METAQKLNEQVTVNIGMQAEVVDEDWKDPHMPDLYG